MKKTLLLSICLSLPTLALAHKGPRGHKHQRHKRSAHQKSVKVVAPGVHIVMGSRPWSPSYVPPARAGFSWVAGRYVGVRWVPGYWRPVGPPPRTQVVYVVGHWEGESYVDGYWRDESRDGYDWQDGYYDDEGTWVDGGWILTDPDGTEVIIMNDPGPSMDDLPVEEGLEVQEVEAPSVQILDDSDSNESVFDEPESAPEVEF